MDGSAQQLQHSRPVHIGSGSLENKVLKDNWLQNASGNEGSGHLTDSGYNSCQSFNASSSVAVSVLATIDEDDEPNDSFEEVRMSDTPSKISAVLTPTTAASIEQISNFHLTTPSDSQKVSFGGRRVLACKSTFSNQCVQLTPRKLAYNNLDGIRTPPRLDRKCELGSLTPRKSKGSVKRKHGNLREKLYSDSDLEDIKKLPQGIVEDDCKKLDQEDISPILHSKRRRNSVIDQLMRSSTPKTASCAKFRMETRENINPMRKRTVLRKIQSFSPSKMASYRRPDKVLQEKPFTTNRKIPLRRQNAVLDISQQNTSKEVTPEKIAAEYSTDDKFDPSLELHITPIKQGNMNALIDAPLLAQSTTGNDLKEEDLDQELSVIPSFDDCSFTPNKPGSDSVLREAPSLDLNKSIPSIIAFESTVNDYLTLQKTPVSASKVCRLKRLTNRLSSSKKDKTRGKPSSPKYRMHYSDERRRCYAGTERLNILKRLNEQDKDALQIILNYLADTDLVQVVAVSRGWRSIIENDSRANRRLQSFLASEAQIKENLDRTGMSSLYSSRESSLSRTGKSLSCDGSKELVHIVRQPFSLCNSIDRSSSGAEINRVNSIQKSPPVSPSKRKFRDNQKVASHLTKSERLKPCPRCEKPSRVMPSKSAVQVTSAESSATRMCPTTAKLEKSYTLPDPSTAAQLVDSAAGSPSSPFGCKSERARRNLFSTSLLPRSFSVDARTPIARPQRRRNSSDMFVSSSKLLDRKSIFNGSNRRSSAESQCDYAICSGQSCGYVFCVKCLCEYHPESICKDLAPNSPSKEEDVTHNVACSKQSRRSLLRLRK